MHMFKKLKQFWEATGNFQETDAILEITKDISAYWKTTNNFQLAHKRYLNDLNYRFDLNLTEEQMDGLVMVILMNLLGMGLSQSNSMYIFSQFLYFHVFGGHSPNKKRNTDEYIFHQVDNLEKLLVPPIPYQFKEYKAILSNKVFNAL